MVNPGIMNHDFADVRAIMSETGKVHLGTGVAEGKTELWKPLKLLFLIHYWKTTL